MLLTRHIISLPHSNRSGFDILGLRVVLRPVGGALRDLLVPLRRRHGHRPLWAAPGHVSWSPNCISGPRVVSIKVPLLSFQMGLLPALPNPERLPSNWWWGKTVAGSSNFSLQTSTHLQNLANGRLSSFKTNLNSWYPSFVNIWRAEPIETRARAQ